MNSPAAVSRPPRLPGQQRLVFPTSGDALVVARPSGKGETLEREITRGYDIVFIGLERPIAADARHFEEKVQELLTKFAGPVAIAVNGAGAAGPSDIPLDILLPASGAQDARLATEIALSLAHASKGGSPRCTSSIRRTTRPCCADARAATACRCWSTSIGWESAAACRSRG